MAIAPPGRSAARARVLAMRDGESRSRADRLAAEEPMEIRAAGPGAEPVPIAVTMRTPGHDFELAAGFLRTEGLVGDGGDVVRAAYCGLPADEQHYNVVTVTLARPLDPRAIRRSLLATSACGICGTASLDALEVDSAPLGPGPAVVAETLLALPAALREAQVGFEVTGGLHAAGLFAPDGRLLRLREDVGRHNAVDKIVGSALLAGELPLRDLVLMVSGRLGFEIVQKAAVAGIGLVAAVSAPTSLAVAAADRLGMTVVGFLRGRGFNVYAHPERIAGP